MKKLSIVMAVLAMFFAISSAFTTPNAAQTEDFYLLSQPGSVEWIDALPSSYSGVLERADFETTEDDISNCDQADEQVCGAFIQNDQLVTIVSRSEP